MHLRWSCSHSSWSCSEGGTTERLAPVSEGEIWAIKQQLRLSSDTQWWLTFLVFTSTCPSNLPESSISRRGRGRDDHRGSLCLSVGRRTMRCYINVCVCKVGKRLTLVQCIDDGGCQVTNHQIHHIACEMQADKQRMKLDIKSAWTICPSTINFFLPFSGFDLP